MNTTKVITIAGIMVVLLVVFPQRADAGTSFSIGVRIGGGSLRIGNYERDNILPGGCHTPDLHRCIGHCDCGHRRRHPRRHYGVGANSHRISLPRIAYKRTGGRFGSSPIRVHRNHGRMRHARGRH
ncbi:MAG: hypothetical protein ACYSWP_13085 [Planctomycetota bacterium]